MCRGSRPIVHILYLYLYVMWQYALLCYRATGAIAPHCEFSGVSLDGNCAYVYWGSFTSNSSSVRRAIWFMWFSEPHDTTSQQACPSVCGTWHVCGDEQTWLFHYLHQSHRNKNTNKRICGLVSFEDVEQHILPTTEPVLTNKPMTI